MANVGLDLKQPMRTPEQIEKIKSNFSEPFLIPNLVNDAEIAHLVELFNSNTEKIKKFTGPITLDIAPYVTKDRVVGAVFERIERVIGKFELNAGFWFKTFHPHVIHNDDTYDLKNVYKAINLPLIIDGTGKLPYLCFFDQYYFNGPAKFFKGEKQVASYYNTSIYDYKDVIGCVDKQVDIITFEQYFTHLRPKWLEGLSLSKILECKPGNAICFDSLQLHCSSNFRKLGISSKLAISIFTRLSN